MMNLPQNPIFIVGYPRSGTTLLQRMLAVQSGLYTFPETHYFNVIEKTVLNEDMTGGNSISPDVLPLVFTKLYEKMELCFTDVEKIYLRNLAQQEALSSKRLFETIVSHYLVKINPVIKEGFSFRWVEKTPYHAQFLGRILSMYPEMQALHIIRHPVPTVYSQKKKIPFNRETPVMELAQRWKQMHMYIEGFRENHSDHILTLRYEDLCEHFENTARTISAFLNIPMDVNTRNFLKRKNGQEKFFILPSEKWKLEDLKTEMAVTNHYYQKSLTLEEIREIEKMTTDEMNRYGYESFEGNA